MIRIRDIVTGEAVLEILREELVSHRQQLAAAVEADERAEAFSAAFMAQVELERESTGIDIAKEAKYLRYEDLLELPTMTAISTLFGQVKQVRRVCETVTADLERAIIEIEKVNHGR